MSSLPGMPLRLVLRAAGWGESLRGWGSSGKPLKPLLGLPCAAGEGGGLPVSPEPFPCQALPSLGLSGVGGVAPALPLRDLRTTPFPTARPFGGLCLRGGLLVARPWLLPSGYRLLIFRCGGRCGWFLVAVSGVWGRWRTKSVRFFGGFFPSVFLLKKSVIRVLKGEKWVVTCCFIRCILGGACAKPR